MILISHRGNINGRNKAAENTIASVRETLDRGFDCEIDVWLEDRVWYLGHDEPQQAVSILFLRRHGLWCHAKNLAALDGLLKEGIIETFWHEKDERTLTSSGFIWTYPGKSLCSNSICVQFGPPIAGDNLPQVAGVCSDYIERYSP